MYTPLRFRHDSPLPNLSTYFMDDLLFELDFFKYCKVLSLETKKNLKKDANHCKIAWHSKGQKKNIEKRDIVYIVVFVVQFFHLAGYCKCSNKTSYRYVFIYKPFHIDIQWLCRRRTSTQNTWQQTRYFNVQFDSIWLLLLKILLFCKFLNFTAVFTKK